ncbi:uncharacterized protein STEHIDRAFT_113219 [Stereum hirsutum FP-91666 SS1]|uniref:uncharacterized protein n=1 Tax=Stereum hirsutum (strain FP-91666) TaxID=721885 RepID=UPI000444A130|nr:uncharacterized protein STEHIDRAFT_113219 [Stereum hirsutum FP-91666 SS1]EIM84002.1 hypothetical protein STEHIDRAFT_113219 [Stereum hirsutum FP-91666 SS1]
MVKSQEYWKNLVNTDPARVTSYLNALTKFSPAAYSSLHPGRTWTDRYGHDMGDQPYAASAISETVVPGSDPVEIASGTRWQSLVRAGITEAILRYLLTSPLEASYTLCVENNEFPTELSSFRAWLCILEHGAKIMERFPSSANQKYLISMTQNWRKLMQHATLTIPVITRFFIHATEAEDIFSSIFTLVILFNHSDTSIFDRVLYGIPDHSFDLFFDRLAHSMPKLDDDSILLAVQMLDSLCFSACRLSQESRELTSTHQFLYALFRFSSLFSDLCSRVVASCRGSTRMQSGQTVGDDVAAHTASSQTSSLNSVSGLRRPEFVNMVIRTVDGCVLHALHHEPQEAKGFVKLCTRAGLIDMFESVLASEGPLHAKTPYSPAQIMRAFDSGWQCPMRHRS